ncbi:hypothetical protein B0H13DRAFT_1890622 [Mycena leptocephala]|nr:hypothetical protein B0H13DRAFT_1890622 [Mycena leptocephala]
MCRPCPPRLAWTALEGRLRAADDARMYSVDGPLDETDSMRREFGGGGGGRRSERETPRERAGAATCRAQESVAVYAPAHTARMRDILAYAREHTEYVYAPLSREGDVTSEQGKGDEHHWAGLAPGWSAEITGASEEADVVMAGAGVAVQGRSMRRKSAQLLVTSSCWGLDCSLDSRYPPLSPAALLAPVARPHDIRSSPAVLLMLSSRWPHPHAKSCLRTMRSPYIYVTESTPLPSLHPFPDQSIPYNPPHCDSRSSPGRTRSRLLRRNDMCRCQQAHESAFDPSAGFPFATLRCPLGTILITPSLDSNAPCDKLYGATTRTPWYPLPDSTATWNASRPTSDRLLNRNELRVPAGLTSKHKENQLMLEHGWSQNMKMRKNINGLTGSWTRCETRNACLALNASVNGPPEN